MAKSGGPKRRWRWRCASCGEVGGWLPSERKAQVSAEIHEEEICAEAMLGRSNIEIEEEPHRRE